MKMRTKIQVSKERSHVSAVLWLWFATLVATLILSGCAGADHSSLSSFQSWLDQNEREVEGVIFMRDLNKVAQKHSILSICQLLDRKGC